MIKQNRGFILLILFVFITFFCCGPGGEKEEVSRSDKYQDLVSLFKEWREFQKPEMIDGVPDYTKEAMNKQKQELKEYQNRLAAIDCSSWPISKQVDYHIVRAEMNGLEFDHRVLRPWSRNPCFYVVLHPSPTDVPARVGRERYGVLRLWEYEFPLSGEKLKKFQTKIQAIPKMLDQAKKNLTEEARDLWFLGIRIKKKESEILENLAQRLSEPHPNLVPQVEEAHKAVDQFKAWLEEKHENMTAPSGIGVENYNWYMKKVHLNPYTWEEQLDIIKRELNRSFAHLKLIEHRNRNLPELKLPQTKEECQRRFNEAVDYFMEFLRKKDIFTVPDYLNGVLDRKVHFVPPSEFRDFFTQVSHLDPLPMRCHGTHWFDLARMKHEPHPSHIRRVPLLYNIWDSRAEGLATGMEEMMMHAGLFEDRPRAQELVYIQLANRAARAMGDLKMHSNEFTLEEAVDYAVEWTPRNWLPKEGDTVWFDERLYLNQPGYGTSYVIGKVHIEKLIADCSHQWGKDFTLKKFMDEFHASGMIPVSLIRWEMTGLEDEIKELW